jgi:hypothetical protein
VEGKTDKKAEKERMGQRKREKEKQNYKKKDGNKEKKWTVSINRVIINQQHE